MNIRIKPTLSALMLILVWVVIIGAGFIAAECYSKSVLQKGGWLPPDGKSLADHKYAYQANGFTVRLNTPHYTWNAYDNSFKLMHNALQTDENGFVTGGADLKHPKDSGVVRIFLTGGSTAWGSLQTGRMMDSASYPEGNFTYEASIAGVLKRELEHRHPEVKFEVINAAVVGFLFVQSKALYEYKIHSFDPDIVVNLDGCNDIPNFISPFANGDPYMATSKQWDEDMQLSMISGSITWPYTFMLLNVRHIQAQQKKSNPLAKLFRAGFRPSNNKTDIATEPEPEKYEVMEPAFANGSDRFLYAVDSYLRQLRADSVYSIFCIQPMLSNRGCQKQLSRLELKMRKHLEKVTVADTIIAAATLPLIKEKISAGYLNPMLKAGKARYEAGTYCKAFFYQQYLAPRIDTLAKKHGHSFMDIASYLKEMGADKEFYTDYCHLTPYGNEFVAGLMANEVDKFLANKQR
ncbi:MAG TPA: hypothetical protein VK174_01000 [Chitinophagales bacterium]|nr:hypothetical protein [Chitinophagales bacterium]